MGSVADKSVEIQGDAIRDSRVLCYGEEIRQVKALVDGTIAQHTVPYPCTANVDNSIITQIADYRVR